VTATDRRRIPDAGDQPSLALRSRLRATRGSFAGLRPSSTARSARFAQTGDIEETGVGPFSSLMYVSGPAAAISAAISAEAAARVPAERRAVSSSLFAI
jgi:hypothetical protein